MKNFPSTQIKWQDFPQAVTAGGKTTASERFPGGAAQKDSAKFADLQKKSRQILPNKKFSKDYLPLGKRFAG